MWIYIYRFSISKFRLCVLFNAALFLFDVKQISFRDFHSFHRAWGEINVAMKFYICTCEKNCKTSFSGEMRNISPEYQNENNLKWRKIDNGFMCRLERFICFSPFQTIVVQAFAAFREALWEVYGLKHLKVCFMLIVVEKLHERALRNRFKSKLKRGNNFLVV